MSKKRIVIDGGGVVGKKHEALDNPAICSTYTGNAEWKGETWVFIDGKPVEPLQAQYDRARKAGY